jgi:basic amino acid/polyamine antiporter, APA family
MKAGNLFRTKSLENILKDAREEQNDVNTLKKTLTVKDLTAFGIAAIVGAGIFSTIGNAAYNGGPAISILFIFTAMACGFSALCYAEFASMIPVSGSAYTYAYFSLGEFIAWVIGWDLLLEYAIGNIAVAISWSDYFTGFLKGFNVHIPAFLTVDYMTALKAHKEVVSAVLPPQTGGSFFPRSVLEAAEAWDKAPSIGSFRFIADVPALLIVILITYVVFNQKP